MDNTQKTMEPTTRNQDKKLLHLYVRYPEVNILLDRLQDSFESASDGGIPECLCITGPTGMGKSTVCRFFMNRNPREVTEQGIKIPVLMSVVPAKPSMKTLVTKLLRDLGDPFAEKGNTEGQTARLYKLLKACEVQMIILDEFQHFIDRKSMHIIYEVINWIKNLIQETNIPVVLVGMPECASIIDADPQLQRWFSAIYRLEPFLWTDSRSRGNFRTFLAMVDQSTNLQPSHLSDEDMAARIYYATRGISTNVIKLIYRATRVARRRGLERIDLDSLHEAYHAFFRVDGALARNPFVDDFEQGLTEKAEEWVKTAARVTRPTKAKLRVLEVNV